MSILAEKPSFPNPLMVETLVQALHNGQHLALMLDYDGTLTPIVSRPQDAQLNEEGLKTLVALAQHPQIQLAIISGRSVEQLKHFMQDILPQTLLLAGLHGGQVWDAFHNLPLAEPDEALVQLKTQFLQMISNQLLATYGEIPQGVSFEEKGYTFALHFRLAEATLAREVHALFQKMFDEMPAIHNAFRVQTGHCVIEIVPKPFNKGAGVQFCVDYWKAQHPQTSFFPLFAGDDKTDELGLKAVLTLEGAGIAVSVDPQHMQALTPHERDALWVLKDPAELHVVLKALVNALAPHA